MRVLKNILTVLLTALCIASCQKDDKLGTVEKQPVIYFQFPQGDSPLDREIQQIAADWGMYIIYKDVDQSHLNRRWTMPLYYDPIYVCTEPTQAQLATYLDLVKKWLLSSLDKNKESDRRSLPLYLYLVNNFHNSNPDAKEGQDQILINQRGMDYWSLSFSDEQFEDGITSKIIHTVACSFAYPSIEARVLNGELNVPATFGTETNYTNPIGIRYLSLEEWKKERPGLPESLYERIVPEAERNEKESYDRRGFASQVGDDFEWATEVNHRGTYGAPTWMPWLDEVMNPEFSSVPATEELRIQQDFLNMIRIAMRFNESQVKSKFAVPHENALLQKSNSIIQAKYNLTVEYMKAQGTDLSRFASILDSND